MVEIEFARTYRAPRQLVWDAWTDPDQIAQWWGPRGVTTPRESIEIDLRPGGRIRFDMVDDATGARYPNSGTVLEVDPPSRLVYSDDGFPDGTGKGTATVTFTAVDERTTTLRVHIVADFDESVRAGAEQGWGSQLDRLAEFLAVARTRRRAYDDAVSSRSDRRVSRLHERLAGGEVAIMDGGTGTGLQAMGVPMDGEAWGGVANLTHLDAVQRLHAAYLAAGAQILITNTFATGPGPLAAAGYGDRFAEANRNAVAAAMRARTEAGADDVLVAGSMSRDVANGLAATGVPFDVSDDIAALHDGYRRQAEILAEAGVDVVVLEMMGARTHLAPAFAAACETGLPVWVGLSIARAGAGQAETIDGEDARALIESLPAGPIDAVFVMHSDVDIVPASLAVVRAVWPGTIGAYPHVGDWEPPNWVFREIAPADFAQRAHEWVAAGAAIVGGCCGTGPEHIAALTAAFPVYHRPPPS